MSYTRYDIARRKRRHPKRNWTFALTVGLVMVLGIGGTIVGAALYNNSRFTDTCKVTDKDRSTNSDGASVYRVYTDCGVFTIEDNLFYLKFNSADTYATIKPGTEYKIEGVGFRNGMLSMFPNIISAVPVS